VITVKVKVISTKERRGSPVPVVHVSRVRTILNDPAWITLSPLGHDSTKRERGGGGGGRRRRNTFIPMIGETNNHQYKSS